MLAATSDRFRALHAALGQRVSAVFPDAAPVVSYDRPAWAVAVPRPPPAKTWKGTLPREELVIAPSERNDGVTIHVWHPNEPGLLAKNEDRLSAAGFKVMVGCLQWNRKADLPLDAIERLLRAEKDAL